MPGDEGERTRNARRAYEAFRRSGADGILQFLDPEVEWRAWSKFAREPKVVHGHAGVKGLFAVYEENFDELRAEPLEFIEVGDDLLVVPFLLTGRQKGTDDRMEIELVHVWKTDGERASRLDVYDSKDEALKAVGLNETD